jgi:hypothetical protein
MAILKLALLALLASLWPQGNNVVRDVGLAVQGFFALPDFIDSLSKASLTDTARRDALARHLGDVFCEPALSTWEAWARSISFESEDAIEVIEEIRPVGPVAALKADVTARDVAVATTRFRVVQTFGSENFRDIDELFVKYPIRNMTSSQAREAMPVAAQDFVTLLVSSTKDASFALRRVDGIWKISGYSEVVAESTLEIRKSKPTSDAGAASGR